MCSRNVPIPRIPRASKQDLMMMSMVVIVVVRRMVLEEETRVR